MQSATVAAISASGLVRALLPGEAVVVVRTGQAVDTLRITVLPRPTTLLITPRLIDLTALGAEATLVARVLDVRGAVITDVPVSTGRSRMQPC